MDFSFITFVVTTALEYIQQHRPQYLAQEVRLIQVSPFCDLRKPQVIAHFGKAMLH